MQSLRELFQIGAGPSSSHTMGPQRAAARFLERHPTLASARAVLYGSLGATGRGHLTDRAIADTLAPRPVEIVFRPEQVLPFHPNGLELEGVLASGERVGPWRVYSVGGGALREEGAAPAPESMVYALHSFDELLTWSKTTGQPLWRHVEECEGPAIFEYLDRAYEAMRAAIDRGLAAEGVLPGSLRLPRKARACLLRARESQDPLRRTGTLAAYSLAVAEENAAGHIVVTAPTCGSSGVLPGTLRYLGEALDSSRREILHALAIGGLVGNLVKANASISGAEVGCQGEIGTACAMAAAAAASLMRGSTRQIEYAAEMGLEHHLGLTCDPIAGLVQIPCIERNAFAASRAVDCADYALLSDGTHRVSFDQVTRVMKQTGRDMLAKYRETATGGLALVGR